MSLTLMLALSAGGFHATQPPIAPPPSEREILLPQSPPSSIPAPPPVTGRLPAARLVPTKTPTIDEFADSFRPVAGVHEVRIIHPMSGRPVDVAFRLPEGNPKVRVGLRSVTFQYPRHEVSLIFRVFGNADVRYN